VTAEKSKADAVTDLPPGNRFADRVDDADNFVPGYYWPLGVGAHSLNGE
jgi:hypothetical protein